MTALRLVSLVRFLGPWTAEERDLISRAARSFERKLDSGWRPGLPPAWTAQHLTAAQTGFVATREGMPLLFQTASAHALADAIRQTAKHWPEDPDPDA